MVTHTIQKRSYGETEVTDPISTFFPKYTDHDHPIFHRDLHGWHCNLYGVRGGILYFCGYIRYYDSNFTRIIRTTFSRWASTMRFDIGIFQDEQRCMHFDYIIAMTDVETIFQKVSRPPLVQLAFSHCDKSWELNVWKSCKLTTEQWIHQQLSKSSTTVFASCESMNIAAMWQK